jgi:hypothetical protein
MANSPRGLLSTCLECGREFSFPEDSTVPNFILCDSCHGKHADDTVERHITISDQNLKPAREPQHSHCQHCGEPFTVDSTRAGQRFCQTCDPDDTSLLKNLPQTWTEREKKQYESYLANPMD